MTNIDSILKSRDFGNKGPSSQGYGFSSGHVWMRELDYKESRVLKNWYFWTVVLEKTLESPLDCKEIQPVPPKGDQSLVFIGGTDVEAETPILWPPDAKSWLIWKDPDAGKDWGQKQKGTTENEMVGWHHWLNGHGFGWTPGVGDGQGGLVCYGSWDHKESDPTEPMNWTEPYYFHHYYLYLGWLCGRCDDTDEIFVCFILKVTEVLMWLKWQPTPVFLPRESCGQRSLVGCCPWGRTELDTTEVT